MPKLRKMIIEAREKESGGVNVKIDSNADFEFVTINLARSICNVNNIVNDSGAFKCKNGFWLCVREMVDKMIADNAGVNNEN